MAWSGSRTYVAYALYEALDMGERATNSGHKSGYSRTCRSSGNAS